MGFGGKPINNQLKQDTPLIQAFGQPTINQNPSEPASAKGSFGQPINQPLLGLDGKPINNQLKELQKFIELQQNVLPNYKSNPLKHHLDDENENVKRIKSSLLEMNEIIKIHKNIVKQTTVITKDNIQITFDIKENDSTIQHNYIYNY